MPTRPRALRLAIRQRRGELTASGDLRKEKYLAVGADRLEQVVLVDLAVDGDGYALAQVRLDLGMQFRQLLEELLDGRRRQTKLGDAPREPREVADQHNAGHRASDLVEPALLQRLQHLRWRHRQLGEADAGGLFHGVRDGA